MNRIIAISIFGAVCLMISCKSEYHKTIKREMSSGIKHDSLILGMYMGQTQKEFYAHCWQLNADQLIHQGSGNRYALQYLDTTHLADKSKKLQRQFYGIFDEEKVMQGMEMIYTYSAWSPWNDELQSGPLLEKLKTTYEKEYPGNSFIKTNAQIDGKDIFAKIDGNRHIMMYALDHRDVKIKIEDINFRLKH